MSKSDLFQQTEKDPFLDPEETINLSTSLDETIESNIGTEELHQVPLNALDWLGVNSTPHTNRYQSLSLLGEGGMSLVHKVYDHKLQREVALKTLQKNNKNAHLGFLLESRVMSQLDHPGILPVYDVITENENSHQYGYVMRIASHSSLHEYRRVNGSVGVHEICHILKQVAMALEHAHTRGVLHRDIKPQNVLLGNEGEVYLTDWGVCTLLPHHDAYTQLKAIRRDTLVGTPAFMAPEQALQDEDLLCVQTDIYGLGATLYYMLTGQSPVTGNELRTVLDKVCEGEITSPSELWRIKGKAFPFPHSLEEICIKALAKDPSDRFRSAREMADALESCSTGQLEIEQARHTADEAFGLGQLSQNRFKEYTIKCLKIEQEIEVLRATHNHLRSDETREHLWSKEDLLDQELVNREENFTKAVSAYQSALRSVPNHEQSRAALFSLYKERYLQARQKKDTAMKTFFEGRLRAYGTTEELRIFDRPSEVTLIGLPQDSCITIIDNSIKRRVLQNEVLRVIENYQGQTIFLPRGDFILEISATYCATIRVPLQLGDFHTLDVTISLPKAESIPKGFVYIGDRLAISKYPTTVSEYYCFLNHLVPEEADKKIPRYHQIAYAERAKNGRFELPYTDIEGDEWQAEWPVFLISYLDARAYCEWLGQVLGKDCRLPSAEEWRYAATSGNHRRYPWGDDFDPSLCVMRKSHEGRPRPKPVGSAKTDLSPLGVGDVAGIICQWSSSEVRGMADHYKVMGAAYNSFEIMCQIDQEMIGHAQETLSHLGFRPLIELNQDDFYTPNS